MAYDLYPLNNQGKATGLGRIGKIAPLSLQAFIAVVKKQLHIAAVNVVGRPEQMISKVAVCGGSGASLVAQAQTSGADVFVTGDVKYHDALDAAALGIAVIDAGHYATEQPIVAALASYLQECFPTLIVQANHFSLAMRHLYQRRRFLDGGSTRYSDQRFLVVDIECTKCKFFSLGASIELTGGGDIFFHI